MLPFAKVSATGNDFLLLRATGLPEPAPALARRLCDRRRSLGADGLVTLRRRRDGAWRVIHLEPDGARTFCLNALRGVAAWARAAGRWDGAAPLRLLTDAGPVSVCEAAVGFEVELAPPRALELRRVALDDGGAVEGTWVDVGNPQLVVVLPDGAALEAADLMDLGRALRWHPAFLGGTNVDFVARVAGEWRVRTYERGVEGETLACGSGVVATACALARAGGTPSSIWRLRTRGGEVHTVRLEAEGERWTRVASAAPAEVVARGRVPTAHLARGAAA